MDSGNSGSLQSSSGGDDEFDSRAGGGVDSSPLSALLRPSPSPSAAAFSLHGSYFGFQELTSAPPPQQPQAGTWSSGSYPGASGLSSSSSPRVAQPDSGAGGRQQAADTTAVAAAQGQGAAMGGAPAPSAQQQTPRGSRKRTRASRRAPTTVLNTDTSNFRAMVQEFTGIPSPPFGAGVGGPAALLRTRFDHIFPPPSSSLRSAAAADATASLPPYLLRPFPHKLPTVPSSSFPPFTTTTTSSSSFTPSSSNIGVANANAATGTAATAAAAPSNPVAPTAAAAGGAGDTFQQLTSSALLRLQQDPSSYLSFQNLLDSQPSSQSIFGAAAGGFGQASSRLHDPAPSPSDFLASVRGSGSLGGLTHHGGLLGSEGLHLHHHSRSGDVHGGDELSGVVAAGASGGSCKLNYSSHAAVAAASSSGAASRDDKPPDGGGGGGGGGAAAGRPGRGEGQLDPWICTSE